MGSVSIPIKDNARAVIASLGRMLYFRDLMEESEFFKIFAKQMDMPVARIVRQLSSPLHMLKVVNETAIERMTEQATRLKKILEVAAGVVTDACQSWYEALRRL